MCAVELVPRIHVSSIQQHHQQVHQLIPLQLIVQYMTTQIHVVEVDVCGMI